MNNSEFTRIVTAQIERCETLLTGKGKEYADGADLCPEIDRLEHFKKAAVLQGETVEQAAFGMLAKHLVSLADMSQAEHVYPLGVWNEKITDSINYLLILRAIVEERQEKK